MDFQSSLIFDFQMMKALITDDVHPILTNGLVDLGFSVANRPDLPTDEIIAFAKPYDLVVINSRTHIKAAQMELLPNLRVIARLGSGLEIIDLDEASRRGIRVISAPEGNCQAVAEHALGAILSLFNKLSRADRNVKHGHWEREEHRGLELQGRTIALIGFGHTGQAFARLLHGFDVAIMIYDIIDVDLAEFPKCQKASIGEIQEQASVVSLHVSYNDSIHHLVDQRWINDFSKPFFLINTSRGMVVSLADLIPALQSGKVLGACLDVLENERPTTFTDYEKSLYSQLYQLPNVLLTPHVAGWTVESKEKIAQTILQKTKNWLLDQSDSQNL